MNTMTEQSDLNYEMPIKFLLEALPVALVVVDRSVEHVVLVAFGEVIDSRRLQPLLPSLIPLQLYQAVIFLPHQFLEVVHNTVLIQRRQLLRHIDDQFALLHINLFH